MNPRNRSSIVLILTVVWPVLADEALVSQDKFRKEIRPVLSRNCFPCHGPDDETREADLRLDRRDSAAALAIDDTDLKSSELLFRIHSDDPDLVMPPPDSGKFLTKAQRDSLTNWVLGGAIYSRHWAFEPPTKQTVPSIDGDSWSQGVIDRFLLAKMNTHGRKPAVAANRYTLVRRLYLDLIGLPPTVVEVDEFVRDHRPFAYERLVDKLLATPRYGERWARPWLDLARYADTNGYEKDRPRSIWPYRDWVIAALNDDMPYDEFSVQQLAGDMLPHPTKSQVVATGFHRNTMLNEEGGIDPLEYRFYAMVDRVATTGTVWMGLTIGCAQCHSHKYDPISHDDYYALMALMNNTNEPDLFLDQPQRSMLVKELADVESAAVQKLLADPEVQEPKSPFATWCREQASHAANWVVAQPIRFQTNLPKLSKMKDDSVFASGDFTKRDEYWVTLANPLDEPITAIKIEAIPDDRLPAAGPGRTYYEGRKGLYFLSELDVRVSDGVGGENTKVTLEKVSVSNSKEPFQLTTSVTDGNGSSGGLIMERWACATV